MKTNIVWTASLLLSLAACGTVSPPVVDPTPPVHTLKTYVRHDADPLPSAFATLQPDQFPTVPCTNTDGEIRCPLTVETGGAYITVGAEGFITEARRIVLPVGDGEIDAFYLHPFGKTPPLRRVGNQLLAQDDSPFIWRFATGFRLVDHIADGNEDIAVAFLDMLQAKGFNGVRVLSTLCHSWFDLCPEDGQRVLPRALELAANRGLYVEVVALAGTKGLTKAAMASHVRMVGIICGAQPNCVVELANEGAHPSQAKELNDVVFLKTLRDFIPASISVSLGSNCCGQSDEKETYPGGDYITIHGDRSRSTWDRTRHVREYESVRSKSGLFVVDDEPIGAGPVDSGSRSTNANEFFARGVLSRVFGFGATFHCQACLQATVLGTVDDPATPENEAAENEAADAFIAGTRIAPDDVRFVFKNATWGDSPVKNFTYNKKFGTPNTAIRAFSGIKGNTGLLVLVGVTGNPVVEMQNGWRVGAVVADRPGIRVLELAK